MNKEKMAAIFTTVLYQHGLPHGGAATADALRLTFVDMRKALESANATDDDKNTFIAAIQSRIDDAVDLPADQRKAAGDVLASTFDGFPRDIPSPMVIRALFLDRVAFE